MQGYSGKPLLKKLGFRPGQRLLLVNTPPEYHDWLGDFPAGSVILNEPDQAVDAAHLFVTEQAVLTFLLTILRETLERDGFIWVSWPKLSSPLACGMREDNIREAALPLGFVDIKVCAVSADWSGLKLVIRKAT